MAQEIQHNRRNFLKNSSAALIAATLLKDSGSDLPFPSMQELKAIADKDENLFWKALRLQFPLQKETTYLNNGTMGPSPYPVIEAVKKGMMDGDQFGAYGGWEATHKKIADFVGADETEIALTHNVTDGINITCWGIPLKKGDEVILTTHEHVGNAFPWLNRRKLHGIIIKTFEPASTAAETLNRINALISKKTRAIAVPHIPCTQGQILPAKEICKLAREKGIFSIIDGAHGPGMIHLDLHDMGCDTYASCTHKWLLGPKGTGFLYVRKEFREILQTYFVGGGSDNAKWNMALNPPEMGTYVDSAHRYYGGTQSLGLYKGVDAAIDFFNTIGPDKIYQRIFDLGSYAQEKLLAMGDKIELITPTESISRAGVNGFRLKGTDAAKVYQYCAEKKFRIRVVHENGLNSLRLSTHIYNTKEEIDAFVEVLNSYKI
ncbi:MAG: aminotransferase class V-fold PLP-dependent enzyme [Bacteroidia bacterium]